VGSLLAHHTSQTSPGFCDFAESQNPGDTKFRGHKIPWIVGIVTVTSILSSSPQGNSMSANKDGMITMKDWHSACEQFVNLLKTDAKLSQAKFLDSGLSGDKVTSSKTHRNKFCKYLAKFREGTLEPSSLLRQRTRKYVGLETKLIAYVDAHSRKYQNDKCGMSWLRMEHKCIEWAKEAGLGGEFKCSSGWIDKTLKRHNRTRVSLHEEEVEEEEEQIDTMVVLDPLPKITKVEALQCIDTLKKYCTEKNARDSVHVAMRVMENELMSMRTKNSNTQRSMNSYFAKEN
jgi:hypothetical protein